MRITVIRCYKTKHEPTLTLQFRNPATGQQRKLQRTDAEAEALRLKLIASGKWRVTPGTSMMGVWGAVRISLLEKHGKV